MGAKLTVSRQNAAKKTKLVLKKPAAIKKQKKAAIAKKAVPANKIQKKMVPKEKAAPANKIQKKMVLKEKTVPANKIQKKMVLKEKAVPANKIQKKAEPKEKAVPANKIQKKTVPKEKAVPANKIQKKMVPKEKAVAKNKVILFNKMQKLQEAKLPLRRKAKKRKARSQRLVPGDYYDSVFSFDIATPKVQVDSRLWTTVVEGVPAGYTIPDPDFIESLSPSAEQVVKTQAAEQLMYPREAQYQENASD